MPKLSLASHLTGDQFTEKESASRRGSQTQKQRRTVEQSINEKVSHTDSLSNSQSTRQSAILKVERGKISSHDGNERTFLSGTKRLFVCKQTPLLLSLRAIRSAPGTAGRLREGGSSVRRVSSVGRLALRRSSHVKLDRITVGQDKIITLLALSFRHSRSNCKPCPRHDGQPVTVMDGRVDDIVFNLSQVCSL